MTIDQLRYLVLVHHTGSMNKASELVYISHQALNASMNKLEEELSCELFIRHARGVVLSEKGLLLEKAAEKMLQTLDDVLPQLQTPEDTPPIPIQTEELIIFTPPIITSSFIPTIMEKFLTSHPSIKLSFSEKENNAIIQQITKNQFDAIGLLCLTEPLNISNSPYKEFFLGEDKLMIATSNQHPLAKQKSVSIRTILKYPLAIYQVDYETKNPICTILEKYGTPNYLTITNNSAVYCNSIKIQKAIGFINRYAIKKNIAFRSIADSTIFLPVNNIPSIKFVAIIPNSYYFHHKTSITNFLNICKLVFANI